MEQIKKEQGKQSLLPSTITPQQFLTTTGSILTGGVIDLATHNMGAALAGTFVTVAVGFLGGDVVRCVKYLVPGSDAREVVENTSRVVESVVPTTLSCYTDQSTSAKLKRLFGLKSMQPEARPKADENITRILPENTTYASFDLDDDDDVTLLSQTQKKDGVFRFSELLASGFRPTINKIFVGRRMDNGKDIFVSVADLCHVALAGKTGGGKGSLERLIMAQLCYIGARTLLLNPHYMRWVVADNGKQFDEDWTPFEGMNPRKNDKPYLEVSPLDCADFGPIGQYLEWAVETELQKRKREGREGGKKFKPFFIVIDEWPSIVAKISKASGYLGELLREGRKYGIFVILTSQDFQVKTLGMEGGSIRNCFLTVFYTGGDKTTAKELLHYEKVADIPENSLGKGIILMRCKGTDNEPILARVPFVDNASVYELLGPSTFNKATTTRKNEVAEPQLDWTDDEGYEPVTQKPKQEATLTREQWMAIQGQLPVRKTDDLPEETQVIRSPYPERMAQHLYYRPELVDRMPTQVQPSPYQTVPDLSAYREQTVTSYPATRRSSTALSPLLQKAYDAYQRGFTTSREMAPEINVGKTKAAELIKQLRERRLID